MSTSRIRENRKKRKIAFPVNVVVSAGGGGGGGGALGAGGGFAAAAVARLSISLPTTIPAART